MSVDTEDPKELAARAEAIRRIQESLAGLSTDRLLALQKELVGGGTNTDLEQELAVPVPVEEKQELGPLEGLIRILDKLQGVIDADWVQRRKVSFTNEFKESGEIDLGNIMDFIDGVVPRLDKEGNSKFKDHALFEEFCALMKDQFGLEIVYPRPGTDYRDNKRTMNLEIAGADDGNSGEVIRVETLGLRGRVERPTRVIVGR